MHQQLTILKALVLGVAIAAVAAPTALAEPAPRELGGNHPQSVPAVRKAEQAVLAPDDLPFKRGTSSAESEQNMVIAPDDRPRPRRALQATGQQQSRSPVSIDATVAGGFDWTAAGIGVVAGLGLGLVLVVGGVSPSMRRRQHAHAARS